ncbi:MAG: class I SAM-dependent methyltransferase [Bryobacterales bacterium]|nr:class I SAM-dependent methyltransferase [Bryobacterales bacterium]
MLRSLSSGEAAELRGFLKEAGYTADGIRAVFRSGDLPSRKLRNLPRMLYQSEEPGLLNTLLRWFILGVPAPADAVPVGTVALLERCGLLERNGGSCVSTAMIAPYENHLVVTDHAARVEAGDAPDVVLGLNRTTFLLDRFALRDPVHAALDLGCGNGVIALTLAGHATRVAATDVNPRAIEFAAFNVWLNGMDHVECFEGDRFAPVRGRRFNLILSNPPFFVTPFSGTVFCENPFELDLFCRGLVREAPAYLEEGGFLQLVCEWVGLRGQAWRERVEEWVEGTGCDAWILRGYSESTAGYCEKRLAETRPDDDPAMFRNWMRYYESRGVEAVHGGVIAMRKRSGANWVHCGDKPEGRLPFGALVRGVFVAHDVLERTPDEALMATRPKLAAETRLQREWRLEEGNWAPAGCQLVCTEPAAVSQAVEPLVAGFTALLDGRRTLAEAADAFAAATGAAREKAGGECAAIVRHLALRGLVEIQGVR